jgi:hypothetical protein
VFPNDDRPTSDEARGDALPDGGHPEVSAERVAELAERVETAPAEVAEAVPTLVAAFDRDERPVRGDAVAALDAVARHDPGAVTPAVAALVGCVRRGDLRHDALGVLRVLARHEPRAVRPYAPDVLDAVGEGSPASSRTAVSVLDHLHAEGAGAVTEAVEDLYEAFGVSGGDRAAIATTLSLLAMESVDLVEPVLPGALDHLADEDDAVVRSMVYLAGQVAEAGRHADALAAQEAPLRRALGRDDERERRHAYRALHAAGVPLDDDAAPPEDWSEENPDVPEPSVYRLPAERLRRSLETLAGFGAAGPDPDAVAGDVELDMRFRLSADREFTPTAVVAHVDLAAACRVTDWVDLDANHGYEAGERFVFDRLRVAGPGTTPTATVTDLSTGPDPDLLVYLPMTSDWDRETWVPTVLLTPDGTMATFDAESEADAVAALELAVLRFVEGLTGEQPPTPVPSDLVHVE